MIIKTQALVLRINPFGTTSHIVTWLTPEGGRIVTIVKGACRPKSDFLGQYDLFYTCELLYYVREAGGLHSIRECAPLCARTRLRSDWRSAFCASYLADVVSLVSVDGPRHEELYTAITAALDHLCRRTPEVSFLVWFELKLLSALGLAPQLRRCASCAAEPATEGTAAFSAVRGGLLCRRCAVAGTADLARITPDILSILRLWQSSASPEPAARTRCTRRQLLALSMITGIFMRTHLGAELGSRRISTSLMFWDPNTP